MTGEAQNRFQTVLLVTCLHRYQPGSVIESPTADRTATDGGCQVCDWGFHFLFLEGPHHTVAGR